MTAVIKNKIAFRRRARLVARKLNNGSFRGRCRYCLKEFEKLTVDHLTPISKGGRNNKSNLALVCNACNTQKGDMTDAEFKLELIRRRNYLKTVRGARNRKVEVFVKKQKRKIEDL